MKKDNKGFSLVELIIVIAIMAVLVGLLAPQYLKYVNNSKVSTDISNAQEIATAMNVAFADDCLSSTTSMPDGSPLPASKVSGTTNWVITTDANGVKTITLDSYPIYPDPKCAGGYYTTLHK